MRLGLDTRRVVPLAFALTLACALPACGVAAPAGDAETPQPPPVVRNQDNTEVPSVLDQFADLRHQGDWLAAHPRSGQSITGSGAKHYQGIVRATYTPDGPNDVLYVTKSGHPDNDEHAFLGVIQLSSRSNVKLAGAPKGERLRSNLLGQDTETADTEPPTSDRMVRTITFDDWKHPGGLQMIGDLLVVPMEQPLDANGNDDDRGCEIYFYDCEDRLNPARMDYSLEIDIATGLDYKPEAEAGVVGIVKLPEPDGRFFLVVTWAGDYQVACYISNKTSFFLPDGREDPDFAFSLYDFWEVTDQPELDFTDVPVNPYIAVANVGPWPYATNSADNGLISTFQTMHLLRQPNGKVFMLTARNTNNFSPVFVGTDLVSLFEVEGLPSDGVTTEGDVRFLPASERAFNMMPHDEGFIILGGEVGDRAVFGNGNAGVGAYVSPTGQLLMYACAHNESDENIDLVRMAEFRNRRMTRSPPHCGPQWMPNALGEPIQLKVGESIKFALRADPWIVGSWVDLYEDTSYNMSGRSHNKIVQGIDAADQLLDDFQTHFARLDGAGPLNHNGFNDKASSHRLCLEPTSLFSLYRDDDLQTRIWRLWPQLSTGYSARTNYGTWDASDVATSARFQTFQDVIDVAADRDTAVEFIATSSELAIEEVERRLAVPEVEWDLDGDGVFEIQGGIGAITQSVIFEASKVGGTRIRARRRGVGTDVNGNPVELVIRVVPAD